MTDRLSIRCAADVEVRAGRRGIVLVFVLFAITLAGTLIALTGSSLAQQGRLMRLQQEHVCMQQMADSARAWAEHHSDVFTGAAPVSLDPASMLPSGAAGKLRLSLDHAPDSRRILRIDVTLTLDRRTTRKELTFPFPDRA